MKFDFRTLCDLPKTLSSLPWWSEPAGVDEQTKMVAALDIAGITVQGLELIGRAKTNNPDKNVSFSLVYRPDPTKRQVVQLGRFDWRPLAPHRNTHKSSPPDLFLIEITGSHVHSFALNWSENKQRMLMEIPIARPVDDPAGYRSLLDAVGKEFKIQGLGSIPEPPWQRTLFDGLNL